MNIKFILLCVPALLLSMICQSSAYVWEDDTYFHDKLFNEDYIYTASRDEIIVVFQPEADYKAFNLAHNLDEPFALSERLGIGLYRLPGGTTIKTLIDQINADPVIKKSAPAFINEDGRHAYCVPTELTVQFKDGYDESRAFEIISNIGSAVVRTQRTPGYFTIMAPEQKGYFATIRELYTYDEVKFAEPSIMSYNNALYRPFDAELGNQWAIENNHQIESCVCPPYLDHDIDAIDGWDITKLGVDPDVVIVIIDSGIDLDHLDLQANYLFGYDYINDDEYPNDVTGHGTSCTGIAAATGDNGIGIAGIAYDCDFIALKVSLVIGQDQDRIDALNDAAGWAANYSAMIISMSWWIVNGPGIQSATLNAYNSGALLCASAGNDDEENVDYPARYSHVMAIGATDPCDYRKWPEGCDGGSWGSNYGADLDLAAPGAKIWTTTLGGGYGYFSGTSASCPMVAGVAALIFSKDPSLTNDEVRTIINGTADKPPYYQYDQYGRTPELGYGRINMYAALRTTCDFALAGEIYDGYGGPLGFGCSPYYITSGSEDPYIPNGQVLTIYQGTVIRFGSGKKITALGLLDSYGAYPEYTVFAENIWPHRIKLLMWYCHLSLQNGGAIKVY
jgi:subtilisin family serine protease